VNTTSSRAPGDLPRDQQWLRLGYGIIAVLFLFRLAYIASGKIELSKDEAYQWLWSKHLALSYYSKPLMIAYAQWLGTHLFGDTELGVRFFSPFCSALASALLLRFFAREVNARAGVVLMAICGVTPFIAVGSTLLTIDPLLVLFWTAAMLAGWRAIQPEARTRDWLWVGLWSGLAFLSKYTALMLWICWAVFFIASPAARGQLRRPGIWLALLVNLLCTLPVLIWNSQHGWVTVEHVAGNANLNHAWKFSFNYLLGFLGTTGGLMHPVFWVASMWACIGFWKFMRTQLAVYLFSMGTPVYAVYLLYTIRSPIQPNWIAAAILPMFCLMVVYWEQRWRQGERAVQVWFKTGLVTGLIAVVLALFPETIEKITGRPVPPRMDPLRRVQGWREVVKTVAAERQKLAAEGKPVFIICDHYGLTGIISFYHSEAKRGVLSGSPLAYYQTAAHAKNQLFFWPEYRYREKLKGMNAILVGENDKPTSPSAEVVKEFNSITNLGMFPLEHRGRVTRRLQLWACRDLR